MTDLSGQSLGRYHILERLGEGGMAVVYKAYDTTLEREVAIKIIRQGAFPSDTLENVLKRFEREAKSLARLSHPNIIKVHDFGEHEGSPFLVMEYLPGGTLKKRLETRMSWQEAVRLLLPVARGVAYAHQHGILHRDIKPANILITGDNEPMLTDFGIAKVLQGERSQALTATGMMVGTPEYMAPEQWAGETSPQSDIYSLGIVLYEMITGRKPYVADTPAAILLKQMGEPLPLPSEFVSGLPESLERILIKALARDPENRYADMNAMVNAMQALFPPLPLEPAVPEAGLAATPPTEKTPLQRKPGLRPIHWLTAAAALIGLVGMIYLFGRDSVPASAPPTTGASTVEATATPVIPAGSAGASQEAPAIENTPDACAGATDPGAREKFTLEQITPCLDDISKVNAFMANNIQNDDDWDATACGKICYSPAEVVYQNGVDDLHGLVTLACYLLEKNGWDAYHIGLSIENPVGTNVCGVNTDEGVLVLESNGNVIGPFPTLADIAHFYIEHGKMKDGGQLRTIKASQITQVTSMETTPSLLGLPWVFHPY
jgi:tRNA A-37 threonylcarbamoyl transferase component Bud32